MARTSVKLLAGLTVAGPLLVFAQPLLADDSAAKPGLLDFQPEQAIWVLLIFILLVAILYKTAWKNVLAGLKAREARIRKDISDAEAARLKAEATLKEYTDKIALAEGQIRDMLTGARTEADKIATGVKMNAQQDVEEIKERANKEIETAKTAALSEIYQTSAELATMVAEKILHRQINANDQRDLVSQSLDQLQRLNNN
jgi:F-type H+-transporting ATPase subunit b